MPEFSNWETYVWFQLSSAEDYNTILGHVGLLSVLVQELLTSLEECGKVEADAFMLEFIQSGYPCRSIPTLAQRTLLMKWTYKNERVPP